MQRKKLILLAIGIAITTAVFAHMLENYLDVVIGLPNDRHYDRILFEHFLDFVAFLFSDDAPHSSYCTKNDGVWSYQFENCVGLSDKKTCEFAGGKEICMSDWQSGQSGTYMCISVCQFD